MNAVTKEINLINYLSKFLVKSHIIKKKINTILIIKVYMSYVLLAIYKIFVKKINMKKISI
jgi:hypothetical protein